MDGLNGLVEQRSGVDGAKHLVGGASRPEARFRAMAGLRGPLARGDYPPVPPAPGLGGGFGAGGGGVAPA